VVLQQETDIRKLVQGRCKNVYQDQRGRMYLFVGLSRDLAGDPRGDYTLAVYLDLETGAWVHDKFPRSELGLEVVEPDKEGGR